MRLWPRAFRPDRLFEKLRVYQPWAGYGRVSAARDMRALFLGTELGRRCLWVLFDWCGVHRQSFHPLDTRVTDFNEGRRSIGLKLARLLYDHIPEENEGDETNG